MITKSVEKDESSSKPQPSQNLVEEVVGQATKRKRTSTQSQRDKERKKARKETTEERRQAREATMILAKQAEQMTLTDLRKNTKEITDAVQDGNLKEVIEKSKKPVSNEVTEEEKRG